MSWGFPEAYGLPDLSLGSSCKLASSITPLVSTLFPRPSGLTQPEVLAFPS